MILSAMLTNIRHELQDSGSAIWSDPELTRAVVKSVAMMSRLIPKRTILETTLTREITGETLTITSNTGTLANKPVRLNTLSIPNKTLDTDYTINYLTGVVTEKGSGLPDTTYTVAYCLIPHILDISSLLSDYIRIERVEYPAGDSPATFIVPSDIYGSLIYFKDAVILTTNNHLRIIYLTYWTEPGASAGDYPRSLDNTIIIGGVGQALIFKAEKYVQDAITNIAASKTLLDAISAVTTPSAPSITSYHTAVSTALTAAIARFAAAVTEADKGDTPLANAATASALMNEEVVLGADFLQTGKALINASNAGKDAGKVYGEYGAIEAALARGYGEQTASEVAIATAWEQRAAREMAIGSGYVNEAIQRLAGAARDLEKFQLEVENAGRDIAYFSAQVAQSREYQTTARQYLDTAGRYLSSGQAKINEMLVSLGLKAEFNFYKSSSEQFS